jgi:hypothetical protein
MWYTPMPSKKNPYSFVIRCPKHVSDRIHQEAEASYRTVSGYLSYVLDQSVALEHKFPYRTRRHIPLLGIKMISTYRGRRAGIHFRCKRELANELLILASLRDISVSDFVVYAVERRWAAVDKLNASGIKHAEI